MSTQNRNIMKKPRRTKRKSTDHSFRLIFCRYGFYTDNRFCFLQNNLPPDDSGGVLLQFFKFRSQFFSAHDTLNILIFTGIISFALLPRDFLAVDIAYGIIAQGALFFLIRFSVSVDRKSVV